MRKPSIETDGDTGLPGLRSWGRVYSLVLGLFIGWILLLWWLTESFS